MMLRHFFLAATLALAVGCNRDSGLVGMPTVPTEPSDVLGLELGIYRLDLVGYGLSFDPEILPCTPILVPRQGTHVITYVNLSREGTEYLARQSAGSLTLRFHATAERAAQIPIDGEIGGSAGDSGEAPYAPARDITISVAGTDEGTTGAQLEGAKLDHVSFIEGKITGAISYCDSAGNCSTCPTIRWTLQRAAYLESSVRPDRRVGRP